MRHNPSLESGLSTEEREAAEPMHIVALSASDALQYRELMLEAYDRAADAFTSTAEERSAEPLSWWEKRIAPSDELGQCFGAFLGERLVGTVALEYSRKPKTRHSGLVIGMYVRPAAQGRGAGSLLIREAIAAAKNRQGVLQLRLTVTEGNTPAIRLYEAVGFKAWGTEPMAIRTPSGYKGKVHMVLHLHGADAAA